MPIRILIADDHAAVRAGVVSLLSGTEFEVVAQAEDLEQAIRYATTLTPDIVLTDLRMPDGDGIEALEQIKGQRPSTLVLLFTAAENIPAMIRAYEMGADGFLDKGVDRDQILETLRRVAAGRGGWTRRQLRQIGTAKRRHYSSSGYIGLTEREVQVLNQIVLGQTNDQIAETLKIDSETVKQHVKGLLRRLGVEDRTQAALWAIRNKWPAPDVEEA